MPRKRGRPPKYVIGDDGKPIVGLSYQKSDGRYYATHSKPRKYFTTDFHQSMLRFRRWQAGQESVCACSRRSSVSANSRSQPGQGGNSFFVLVARSNGTPTAMLKRGPQTVHVLNG